MAAKEEHKEDASHDAKPAKGKLVPMVVAVAAILALQAGLAVGVVRWLGVSDHAPAKGHGASSSSEEAVDGEEGGEEESSSPKKLECVKKAISKTVSVSGSQGKRYLKTTFCLEYDAEKYKEFEKEAEGQTMRIEAASQRILSSAPMELVMDPAGQDSIANKLRDEINLLLKPGKTKITAVLITEWLVQ